MTSPYHYTVSSFIVSNLHNTDDSDDELEYDDGTDDDRDYALHSEFSVPTDMDTNPVDSDIEVVDSPLTSYLNSTDDLDTTESVYENNESDSATALESDTEEESAVEQPSKRIKLDTEGQSEDNGNGDPGQTCPICLASWTNVGEHRLCSLRCGHLFGYKCIVQWLKSNNESAKKCPQCNARASLRHIRLIYVNKLTAPDNTIIEQMKKEIEESNLELSKFKEALAKEKKRTKKYKQMYKARTLALTADSDFGFSD